MKRIFLDTETTGLDPERGHRIVEIAAVAYDDRDAVGVFHTRLNPGREVDKDAADVHGLTAEMLAGEPQFAEKAGEFLEFVRGGEVIIHNADFDEGFLDSELKRAGLPKLKDAADKITCSLRWSRENLPGVGSHSLDSLCAHFDVDTSARKKHSALLDTKLLAKVYFLMTAKQGEMALRPKLMSQTNNFSGAVKVIKASEAENAAHLQFLQTMQKEQNVVPLFLRPPEAVQDEQNESPPVDK